MKSRPQPRLQFQPRGARRRRGAMLLAFIVLIPFALAGLLVLQSRLVVALRETARAERRAQARLLADSALAVWRASAGARNPNPIEGRIDGAGRWRIERPQPDAPGVWKAVGEVDGPEGPVFAALEWTVSEDGRRPVLLRRR